MSNNNLGRDKLPWSPEIWNRIDSAVHDEGKRIRIARRFMPFVPLTDALTAPADTINIEEPPSGLLRVEEGLTVPLLEVWVEFAMTKQQVEAEERLGTAVTLATRAANLLAQAEDVLIFQGVKAVPADKDKANSLFKSGKVRYRAGPVGPGLLNIPKEVEPIKVPRARDKNDKIENKYGEMTFEGVTRAYADLQKEGHYGPYALVLHTVPYADTHAPLATTLIMPADRIRALLEKGFWGTGTLEEWRGLLFSLGGNTVDLVIGRDTITAFMQEDAAGMYRFRVFERFAVRDKNPTGRIKLEFDPLDRRPAPAAAGPKA